MKVRRKRYSPEFKQEALRRLQQGDKSITALALELGIQRNQLYDWQQQAQQTGGSAAGAGDQAAEIARLRKELEAVTEERDILKKAAAYFAKDLK
jgi:transposase